MKLKWEKTHVLAVLAAGSIVACSPVYGQDAGTSMSTNGMSHVSRVFGGWNIDKLAKQLSLTDVQKQKVQSILESEHRQMTDLHRSLGLSPDARRSKASEIRENANTNLQSVLTPEQYSKWKNMTHHRVMPTTSLMDTNTNASAGSAP